MLAIGFALLVFADYRYLELTRIVDERAGDLLLTLNTARRPESDRVVIIDIDQRSLEMMNDIAGSWPWPRSVHGELIDYVMRQKPRGVAFDILFNERDIYRPEHDAVLTEAVASHPNVWLAMTLNADGDGAWVSQMPPAIGARPLRRPPVDARVPLMMPLVVADRPE
ncbi:MAG: CHASE2 domain-containing protein, partial [Sphingomonadales bacterium]|nr:CHASE2 domain-containing protein [Sphingomonadales bacterium]